MSKEKQNPKNDSKYDLLERTARFGEEVIRFLNKIPKSTTNIVLVSQAVRSSTSVGANYTEADGAESKKDFQHKIAICKKEAKESMHWFRMLAAANSTYEEECRKLWKESQEFARIFSAMLIKTKQK